MDYKEGTKKKVATARKEEEAEQDDSLNNSGATDDENTGTPKKALRVKIVRAFKATEEDIQTLIASRGRTKEGWKQAFFCDSGADICLVNEAKTKRDRLKVDEKGAKELSHRCHR